MSIVSQQIVVPPSAQGTLLVEGILASAASYEVKVFAVPATGASVESGQDDTEPCTDERFYIGSIFSYGFGSGFAQEGEIVELAADGEVRHKSPESYPAVLDLQRSAAYVGGAQEQVLTVLFVPQVSARQGVDDEGDGIRFCALRVE
ncbi:hypothetical protein QCD60_19055 [Pokkaliibacter sp. MBI-7]|uniref:hypothetical protein n=1 Tax=Pokkaliibacter sp. MBI-7 TaxID=3040600 RepID=UPI00244C3E59|nr:hypothetical protein [Pokkaliibacter sp. MBI-7]MDH2434647.1 hypothetical protein [Pokkaliibacter sp. MBI-7]